MDNFEVMRIKVEDFGNCQIGETVTGDAAIIHGLFGMDGCHSEVEVGGNGEAGRVMEDEMAVIVERWWKGFKHPQRWCRVRRHPQRFGRGHPQRSGNDICLSGRGWVRR
jgi:hypothetical protein